MNANSPIEMPQILHTPAPTRCVLLLTASEKGGVGKSCFAISLVDQLRAEGQFVGCFDGDGAVGVTAATFGDGGDDPLTGAVCYSMRDHSRDALLDSLQSAAGLLVHDLPGGSLIELHRLIGEEGLAPLVESVADFGGRLVIAHMLSAERASIASVRAVLDAAEDADPAFCHHVAVLNAGLQAPNGVEPFPDWTGRADPATGARTGGLTRQRFLERGGLEMTMPKIEQKTFVAARGLLQPWSVAVDNPDLGVAHRMRLSRFRKNFAASLSAEVRAVLGVK